MKKRVISLLLCAVLVLGLLPVNAWAADEAPITVTMADCTQIGTYMEEPLYYMESGSKAASVQFADFATSMAQEGVISPLYGYTGIYKTNAAPISSGYLLGDRFAADEKAELNEEWAGKDFSACYGYFLMNDDGDMYTFILRLPEDSYPFTPSVGAVTSVTEGGYTYDSDWDDVPDAAVDLYTVTVPYGAQAETLTFSEARIAYAYDANKGYLTSCAADAENGYADDGQTGELTANVRLTDGQALPAYVVVQTPYDKSWASQTLYAVQFKYDHTFTVSVNGVPMTEITAAPDAYSYYDYFTQTTTTVMVYTVKIPSGTETVDLTFSDPVLAYSYTKDGTYLAGWYSGDAMYTGGTSASVAVDYDGGSAAPADGEIDYIQVQSPYDESWHSTLYYAITFDDGRAPSSEPSGPPSDSPSLTALLNGIAAGYTDNASEWVIIDMAALEDTQPDSTFKSSTAAKQNYINAAINSLQGGSVSETSYSKAILALTAIGVDTSRLYPVNSNTPINAVEGLNAVSHSTSLWVLPYTLAAYNQGSYIGTDAQEAALVQTLLNAQKSDGSWEEWGTIDTTGNALAALAFYADDPDAQAAIDKGVNYLSSQMKDDGTFDGGYGSNANSCAMVVVGLCAVGVDPSTDSRFVKNGVSALDGLLSFALSDNTGFGYTNNTARNDSATEQGFRALIAAAQVMKTGKAFNVYDFSHNAGALTPGRATGGASAETPADPTGQEITVSFTIKADTGYWMNGKTITLPGTDATVYHAFIRALEGSGIFQVGAENGYVSSMTYNGRTLAEFTNGPDSGWLYKVNGKLPNVGLKDYPIQNGDSIIFYYTNDWTQDPSAGQFQPQPPSSTTLTPAAKPDKNGAAQVSVTEKEMTGVITQAKVEGAAAIVIAPKISGSAEKVTAEVPRKSVESAVKQTNAALTVQTALGSVTLPNNVLQEIAAQAKGSTIAVTVTKKSSADAQGKVNAALLQNAAVTEVSITSGGKAITTFGGKNITVNLPVSGSQYTEGASYLVYVCSGDGTVEVLHGTCVKANGALFVKVTISHLSLFIVTDRSAMPFTDISGHWAAQAIQTAYDKGWMTGMSKTTFAPNATLSRAMVAQILYRLAGSPTVSAASPFTDVSENSWYADAVIWANEQGIVTGMGSGTFAPSENITRQQLAAMLYRFARSKGLDTSARGDLSAYTDADVIQPWGRDAMEWAVASGLMGGRNADALAPNGTATRAEAATLLVRLSALLP